MSFSLDSRMVRLIALCVLGAGLLLLAQKFELGPYSHVSEESQVMKEAKQLITAEDAARAEEVKLKAFLLAARATTQVDTIVKAHLMLIGYYKENKQLVEMNRYLSDLANFLVVQGEVARAMELHNEIASNHIQERNFHQAVEHFSIALGLSKQTDNPKFVARAYHNVGQAYVLLNEFDQAHEQYLAAIAIQETEKDYQGLALSYTAVAQIFLMANRPEDALTAELESLTLNQHREDDAAITHNYINMARIYRVLGDGEKGCKSLVEARRLLSIPTVAFSYSREETLGLVERMLNSDFCVAGGDAGVGLR